MENGSFQNLELSHLEFSDSLGSDLSDPYADFQQKTLKKPTPEVLNFKSFPQDIQKSNTVEALISQNEDTTARLKVALRRMTMIEDENKHLLIELNELKMTHSALSDQMLIWKEKEKIWKERNEKAEASAQEFRHRFPEYLNMEAKIEKLTRYQERVKTTIKPYVQQLKDYAHSLHLQIQKLNQDLDLRDTQIVDRDRQIESLKEQLETKERYYQINQNDLVSKYESEKDFLKQEIQSLQENLEIAEAQAQKLDQALIKQDELENTIISLRRRKEELSEQTRIEMEQLREFKSNTNQELIEAKMTAESLSKELDVLKKAYADQLGKRQDLEEQLTSLRFMWNEQAKEKERLEISLSSLEKINLELSSRLTELRRQS